MKWFLINYFRLDDDIAEYYICDNKNDKGIDGIYTDDLVNAIYVFQSKYLPQAGGDQGDADLRDFPGVKAWFENAPNVDNLAASLANKELKAIIDRLKIKERIQDNWSFNLLFVTNKVFDRNGKEYLEVAGENFEGWDLNRLFSSYTYAAKDKPVTGEFAFGIEGGQAIHHMMPHGVDVFVFAADATDITKLDGIQNGALFDKNVRYWLGNTRINREIAKTIASQTEQSKFMVYNNGITLVAEKGTRTGEKVIIENYAVVNGCQTVLSLYQNKNLIKPGTKVFVKIVVTGQNEELSRQITRFNNNQNSIGQRDLKSNDKVQQDLQKQFLDYFGGKVLFNIKRGEPDDGYDVIIPNDFAAQMITAYVLCEPYSTHQKTEIFTEKYNAIFSRHLSPPLIFVLDLMYDEIDIACNEIKNSGARDYKTTRFFFMQLFRKILDDDSAGKLLLEDANRFYEAYDGKKVTDGFSSLAKLLVIGFDHYVYNKEKDGSWFDYKNALRSASQTQDMTSQILLIYKTSLVLHPEGAFARLIGAN